MAHSLSAKKRVRQNDKSRTINRARKSMVKTQLKKFEDALNAGDKTVAAEQFKIASQKLDKISATSTMHKATAARTKSRMAKKLNAMNG